MRRTQSLLSLFCLGILLLTSCAKTAEESHISSQQAVDAWMEFHYAAQLQAGTIQRLPSGMYIERFPAASPGAELKTNNWMLLSFTSETFGGNLFVSRYKSIAQQMGWFSYFTHYVPFYTPYVAENTTLVQGQREALAGMHAGDSVAIYLPPELAYLTGGALFSGGFGTGSLNLSLPVIIRMKLNEVIPDPTLYENSQVDRYAVDTLSMPLNDTIAKNFYLKIIPYQDNSGNPGKPIGIDSTIKYNYIGKFVDNFIFDTNVDSVAIARNIYSSTSSYTPHSYKLSNKSLIQALQTAFLKMRQGDQAILVFSSTYGYQSVGSSSGATVIPPYSPLVFQIEVKPYGWTMPQ